MMYSFTYYTEEPAPEAVLASEGTTGSLMHIPGSGSPALSSSDDNVSTAGESGFGESDFYPYEYCPSMGGPNNEFDMYDQFEFGIESLIGNLTDMPSESPGMELYTSSLVEVKTEIGEESADVEPEAEENAPTDQEFATFGDMKIEEVERDSGSTITVPISFQAAPTQDRVVTKARRKQSLSRKGKKITSTVRENNAEPKSSAEFAIDDYTGKSEIEKVGSIKSVSPKKRLYEMKREECASEKQWIQVKRAKNTFNFHEKQRKKLLAAEEIINEVLQSPSANRAVRRNPKIRAMINAFFPHALRLRSKL